MKKLLFLLAGCLLSVVTLQAQNRSVEITAYGFDTDNYNYRFVFTVNGYIDNETLLGAFVPTSVEPTPKVIRIERTGWPNETEIHGAVSNCQAYIIPEELSVGTNREFFFSFDYSVSDHRGHAQGNGIIPWRIRQSAL